MINFNCEIRICVCQSWQCSPTHCFQHALYCFGCVWVIGGRFLERDSSKCSRDLIKLHPSCVIDSAVTVIPAAALLMHSDSAAATLSLVPAVLLRAFPSQLTDNSPMQPGLTWEPPITRSRADNLHRKEPSLETLALSSACPRWRVWAESPSRGNACLPLVSTNCLD